MTFYAVAVGRTPGIYASWDEARAQTDGFPGAVHKKFKRRADAESFLTNRSALTRAGLPQTACVPNNEIHMFVDGSSMKSGAGVGVFVEQPHIALSERMTHTDTVPTNQRAELLALIRALELCVTDDRLAGWPGTIVINTDSQYAKTCLCHPAYLDRWLTNGFLKADGTPVMNQDLLTRMGAAKHALRTRLSSDNTRTKCGAHSVVVRHVSAHVGIPGNEMADKLAKQAAKNTVIEE